MIEVHCSDCGATMRVSDQAAGKSGKCKGCGKKVIVPSVQQAEVPAEAEEACRSEPEAKQQDAESKIRSRVADILMAGEELLCVAVQHRPVANFLPDCLALTTRRFMIFRTKLLSRYDFEDHVWRELRDVKIKEGMLGATISVETASGEVLSLDYLPKVQAREAYRLAQELEERALEERRQRALEAERAKSGTLVLPHEQQAAPAPAPTTAAPSGDDPMAKLTQLKSMFDAGLITEDEYANKKAEVLASM